MQRKKIIRPVSLLEIMIVIFLIGLIGGAIGYNMKGSLDKGKEFKTKESMRQIEDVLLLQMAEGATMESVIENPEKTLEKSGLVKDAAKLLKDGWGGVIEVQEKKGELLVFSKNLENYEKKKNSSKK